MVPFLLCNLLEFCLTSMMAFSWLHTHTPRQRRVRAVTRWVCVCVSSHSRNQRSLETFIQNFHMSVMLQFHPISLSTCTFRSLSHVAAPFCLLVPFQFCTWPLPLNTRLACPRNHLQLAWECVPLCRSHVGVCLWFFFFFSSPSFLLPPSCFKDAVVRTVPCRRSKRGRCTYRQR